MATPEDFERQYQKSRILTELTKRDASYPEELSKATGFPLEEVYSLLEELRNEQLVERIVSKYYQLTYDGYKQSKSMK